ncbi:MAG: hypothetical protein QM731_04905 [Chitinophagaceae bacterium]
MAVNGLFINNVKAQDSIYESGVMVYNCLKLSEQYKLDYIEINITQRTIPLGYDFYFFNYHPGTMPWLDTAQLKQIPGLVLTMVLEILPGDPFVLCPPKHFDGYCVLDPTIRHKNPKVFAFPRPLEMVNDIQPYVEKEVPVIGTFGFATKGKGFQHVVDAVNKEFEKAIIRINIPFGNFVPDSEAYSQFLSKLCRERAKEGVEVIVTHDYMSKEQLINWCSQNTLNCFLYDRNMPGLAATTDQAIVAGRPLSVAKNDTFRHILAYLPSYPQWGLQQSINESLAHVKRMQEDWSPVNFARRFEDMLHKLMPAQAGRSLQQGSFELPEWKSNSSQKIKNIIKKYKGVFSMRKLKQLRIVKMLLKYEEPI